jgi:hypothetical protein
MKKETLILQQGDVLLVPEKIPSGKLEQLKTNILEHGEATGHAHRLNADDFEHFQHPETKTRYLRLVKPTKISHEEHKSFVIPPGDYRIGRVREKGMFDDLVAPVLD